MNYSIANSLSVLIVIIHFSSVVCSLNPFALSSDTFMPRSSQIKVVLLDEKNYQGTKIADYMNWTGKAIAFPRNEWLQISHRHEFERAGIYILIGKRYSIEELPALYVGRSERIATRINQHYKGKEFWDSAICFVSKCNELNHAQTAWLEYTFIQYAYRCGHHIENIKFPRQPTLDEFERLDLKEFFEKIVLLLPHLNFYSFTLATPIVNLGQHCIADAVLTKSSKVNTVIASVEPELTRISLAQNCLTDLKLDGLKLKNLAYVALYETDLSSITHIAPIKFIEEFRPESRHLRRGRHSVRYNLIFSEPASKISPIHINDTYSKKYINLNKLIVGTHEISKLSHN